MKIFKLIKQLFKTEVDNEVIKDFDDACSECATDYDDLNEKLDALKYKLDSNK